MRDSSAPAAMATAYFLHAAAGDARFQNVQLSLNLGESCPVRLLHESWQQVTSVRQELRCTFRKAATGETLRLENTVSAIPWKTQDWKELPFPEIARRWKSILEQDAGSPFDLASPPLLRFQAIELPGGHCQLLLTFPKILIDEDALFSILGEWLQTLQGNAPSPAPVTELLPPSPATAEWWSRFFSGETGTMALRVHPHPVSERKGFPQEEQSFLFDREASRAIRALSQQLDLPVQDIFLAAWSLVLSRLSSSRSAIMLASCMANLLPFRFAFEPDSKVEDWLRAFSKFEKDRVLNSSVNLERTFLLSEPPRSLSEFPACFLWSPSALNDRIHDAFPRWINLDARQVSHSQFPLSLRVRDGHQFFLQLEVHPDFCPSIASENLLSRVVGVIEAISEDSQQKVGRLELLTPEERQALISVTPLSSEKPEAVEKQIAATAARQPDSLAVSGPFEASLSFGDLESHAQSLAGWLQNENLADGWNIAVCLTATSWLPVAILGILKAGDTCVPLDPASSPAWLCEKIESSDVEMIICDSRTAPFFEKLSRKIFVLDQQWEAVAMCSARISAARPKNAFLLTGTGFSNAPYGGSLSSEFTATACRDAIALWSLKSGDRIPLLAAPGTGAFVEILLSSLISGATLLLPDEDEPLNSLVTATHLRLSAAQWRAITARLQRSGSSLPESLHVVCVAKSDGASLLEESSQLLNKSSATGIFFFSPLDLSGASLRTTDSQKKGWQEPTLMGLPGPDVTVRLLDSAGQSLPPHFSGKIEIAFPGNDSPSFFMPAWRDRSGAFHFVPPERELLVDSLRKQAEVLDVHCSAATAGGPIPRGAWVILQPVSTITSADLMARLRALPENLRPRFLQIVNEFPLNSSGNIQESDLPRPGARPPVPSARRPAAKTSPLPIAKVWEPLVLLHETRDAPILFLIHDIEGEPEKYRPLAALLKEEWTLYGTTARGLHDASASHLTVESEAASLIQTICVLDPAGPFHFFGFGYGASLAMEMARQLRIAGREVPYLALAGARPPQVAAPANWKGIFRRAFSFTSPKQETTPPPSPVAAIHLQALQEHRAQPLAGPAGIILGSDRSDEVERAWLTCAPDAFFESINCPASQMLDTPSVKRLTAIMREWMLSAEGS